MTARIRRILHAHVPANLHDPFGLFVRILRSRDPDAIFAAASAALGVGLTPLDLLLQPRERRLYRKAPPPRLPLVVVVGAPRSGTTLVAQVLIRNLPVAYLNNLTSLFPRSPIAANLLFRGQLRNHRVSYQSFYGKTRRLSGPNDGLYIWDRWLGRDRKRVPASLSPAAREDMVRFFGAFEAALGKPVVNKNNRLVACAHLVAEALPGSRFICMRRDPLYLAQSLLLARRDIHGSLEDGYGIEDPDRAPGGGGDPIQGVCDQVLFHERLIRDQESRIGTDRFRVVSYEEFCREPARLVRKVSEEILGRPLEEDRLPGRIEPFQAQSRRKVPEEDFERLRDLLLAAGLRAGMAAAP